MRVSLLLTAGNPHNNFFPEKKRGEMAALPKEGRIAFGHPFLLSYRLVAIPFLGPDNSLDGTGSQYPAI